MVLALRKMGCDAWLVCLGDSTTVTEGRPVLAVPLEEIQSAEWWKSQRPDAVQLSTWSAPRFDALRKAALAATPRVVERFDTDGNRSARLFPRPYFIQAWGSYRDTLPAYARWLAPLPAAARTALFFFLPALMDARMVATMRQLPAAIAESPLAAERMQRMIQTYSGASYPIKVIPHPVNEDALKYTGGPKENRIIAVGRWGATQKDYPMLRNVLRSFLQRHPDWQAAVVGNGVPARDRDPGDGAEEWQRRMTFHEKLAHEQLSIEYNRAKIYLMVSRHESFCIAAAEALCCGCSVVGSCSVPTSYFFAENQSGSVAAPRTAKAFLETLEREVECWTKGERNPATIASVARDRFGARAVAEATLALWEQLPPGNISSLKQ
ncbi:MAG: glycosyltransferase [Methylacidiphilales bacterium]|nr:glycosyltransferase [Candidatus Methylacidiphilales bacterium]